MSWAQIFGSAADAYGEHRRAEGVENAARIAERERQRALRETQSSVWLWLGFAGAVCIIVVTIFFAIKK